MAKRGPKSAAELSVVPIGIDTRRPDPPKHLTKKQAAIWRAIVASLPGGWMDKPQEPLLEAYCRHVAAGDYLSGLINELIVGDCDLQHLDRLLRMRERETRASTALATKMRLTQQAKMHPRSAGRAAANHHPGEKLWDRKPWDE